MEHSDLSKKYHNFLEPILVVDTVSSTILYCNEITTRLGLADDTRNVSILFNNIGCKKELIETQSRVLLTKEQEIIKDCSLKVFNDERVSVDITVRPMEESETEVCYILCITLDDLETMFLENRCFNAIYGNSLSFPFYLDVKKKRMKFIGEVYEHFNISPILQNYPEGIIEAGLIHHDDIEAFRNMVDRMYGGQEAVDSFRSYANNGDILWYQPRYTTHYNDAGELIEVIGEFINIQERKELEELLHYDELTNCLNKATFNSIVSNVLQKTNDQHALFIIDLDNFKIINDNLGHQFGDAVLRSAGLALREVFRASDYIGRIGGDEFMVFMKSSREKEVIEERAKQVLTLLSKSYDGNYKTYKSSSSIGIARYPQDGEDFTTLYEHADIALYDTKSRGKNDYTFYSPVMKEGNMSNTTPFDVASRALSQHFDQQTIVDIFSLLSEAIDYKASLNKVIELLAVRFNAERCYIFELDQSGESLNNTYEWCAPGINPEIQNLQHVPQLAYQPLVDLSNKEGIFYCNDLSLLKGQPTYDVMNDQGIQSCLLAFNLHGKKVHSMVGFDDCTNKRIWGAKEISTLMHATKIIEQFLKHIGLVNELDATLKEKLKVIDEIYSLAYIVDVENNELMYMNHFFKEAFPRASLGDKCYDVIQATEKKCEDCPIPKMEEEQKEHYRSICPMNRIIKRMLVNSSKIGLFEGKECVFFSCSDIDDLDDKKKII